MRNTPLGDEQESKLSCWGDCEPVTQRPNRLELQQASDDIRALGVSRLALFGSAQRDEATDATSFEPLDYVRHILAEMEYLREAALELDAKAFLRDETRKRAFVSARNATLQLTGSVRVRRGSSPAAGRELLEQPLGFGECRWT